MIVANVPTLFLNHESFFFSRSSADLTNTFAMASSPGSPGTKVRFEDILQMVGENGRWQIVIFLFTWIEGMLIGCHHLSSTFLGASMDHWCNVSHIDAVSGKNWWTDDQKKTLAIPKYGNNIKLDF